MIIVSHFVPSHGRKVQSPEGIVALFKFWKISRVVFLSTKNIKVFIYETTIKPSSGTWNDIAKGLYLYPILVFSIISGYYIFISEKPITTKKMQFMIFELLSEIEIIFINL